MTIFSKCRVPVLMYHALEDEANPAGAKDVGEQLYVLQVKQFQMQLEYLKKQGFVSFFLEEILGMDDCPDNAIVLTFDDGHLSNYTLAMPMLKFYGFKAHFFVTTGWLNTPYFLKSNQVKRLSDEGMRIGSHGVTHKFFNEMTIDIIKKEMEKSRDDLQFLLGTPVTSFSAPGGRITSATTEVGRRLGYSVFCTSRVGMFRPGYKLTKIPRFAIKSNNSIKDFEKIVTGDFLYCTMQNLRYIILNIIKKMMGENVYIKYRSVMIK